MGTEIKTWQIIDKKLTRIATTLANEGHNEPYDLQPWLESNSEIIGTDIAIIGSQVLTRSGKVIDLLGIDQSGNTVIIEIKRAALPREALAQAIDYASDVAEWGVEKLGEVCSRHKNKTLQEVFEDAFRTVDFEIVNFNSTQRIILVGFSIEASLERMIDWLSDSYGVSVNAVVISYIKTKGGEELLAKTMIISEARENELTGKQPKTRSPEEFFQALDQNGRTVFESLRGFAETRGMPLNWGTRGCSLNADLDGTRIAVCYFYPPDAVFRQSIYTNRANMKTQVPDDEINRLWSKAETTGLFRPAGQELKCSIDRPFTGAEIEKLLGWCEDVATTIKKAWAEGIGLAEPNEPLNPHTPAPAP